MCHDNTSLVTKYPSHISSLHKTAQLHNQFSHKMILSSNNLSQNYPTVPIKRYKRSKFKIKIALNKSIFCKCQVFICVMSNILIGTSFRTECRGLSFLSSGKRFMKIPVYNHCPTPLPPYTTTQPPSSLTSIYRYLIAPLLRNLLYSLRSYMYV